jgi:hypothetical protein
VPKNPLRLKLTRKMTVSVWRLEPGGAEGQLESMATRTTMMLPPMVDQAQVLSRVLLHNGNGDRPIKPEKPEYKS